MIQNCSVTLTTLLVYKSDSCAQCFDAFINILIRRKGHYRFCSCEALKPVQTLKCVCMLWSCTCWWEKLNPCRASSTRRRTSSAWVILSDSRLKLLLKASAASSFSRHMLPFTRPAFSSFMFMFHRKVFKLLPALSRSPSVCSCSFSHIQTRSNI